MRKAFIKENKIYVKFSERDDKEFYRLLRAIKSIDGRYFEVKNKRWVLIKEKETIDKLLQLGFEIAGLEEESEKIILNEEQRQMLKGLRNYQIEGVEFLLNRNGRGLIADEMGTGKTIQTIGYLKITKKRPVLIICPSSVKFNWGREVKKWLDEEVEILQGQKPYELDKINIVIINYAIVRYWKDYLKQLGFKVLVVDESHYIANTRAKRTKAVMELAKVIDDFIALSGTPIKNRPKEFFTTLHILDPEMFKSHYYYLQRYCEPKYNGFGWTYNGATNVDELIKKVKPLMIRREKKDVLKELPEKTRIVLELEGDLTKYNEEYKKILEKIKETKKKLVVHNLLDYLKSLTWNVKRKQVFDWIDNFLETGKKLVIFGVHTAVLFDLYERYKDIAVKLDGSVQMKDRQNAIDRFQNDNNIKLFIGNINAAGVGITLTASSDLLFVELSWVPSDHTQAEDRVHRMGQSNPVFIYYLVAKNTIEAKMVNRLIGKSRVVNKILNEREESLFDDVIKEVL